MLVKGVPGYQNMQITITIIRQHTRWYYIYNKSFRAYNTLMVRLSECFVSFLRIILSQFVTDEILNTNTVYLSRSLTTDSRYTAAKYNIILRPTQQLRWSDSVRLPIHEKHLPPTPHPPTPPPPPTTHTPPTTHHHPTTTHPHPPRMKMSMEQRWPAMLQLHLSDQQFYHLQIY